MSSTRADANPQTYARVAGALYLTIFLLAPFAEFAVREGLLVPGDPAATARHIRDSEGLFRAGFASDLAVFAIEVVQAALLYALLRPAGRVVSLIMAFARLAQATALGLNLLNMHTALQILTRPEYTGAFSDAQVQTLAMVFLDAQRAGYDLALVFFAVHLAALGYLVFRSGFLPRVLGILLVVSAAGYALNSFTLFLMPALAGLTGNIVIVTAIVGELPLTLWLLIKGVDVSRWHAAGGDVFTRR